MDSRRANRDFRPCGLKAERLGKPPIMRAKTSMPVDRTSDISNAMRDLLRDVLALSQERVDAFDADTPLFGALPELDSMAVATLLTEMEDRLDILIEDDDIDGETFETFGTLVAFVRTKLEA